MDHDTDERRVGTSYPYGQLAKALVTAMTHQDAAARDRAQRRISRWQAVLRGMTAGKLRIGSRAPVANFPVWVTPDVIHGGFVTGRAMAEGDLRAHEAAFVDRIGLPHDREAIFAHCLSERGLTELDELLRTGPYRIGLPEEAALLAVVWLGRAGDISNMLALVDTIRPYASRLCFLPRPGGARTDLSTVSRETVAEVGQRLAERQPNGRVETMREALTIWNPFGDELLALWLDSAVDGRVGMSLTDAWRARAVGLGMRYLSLVNAHRRCTKHRNPKANLGVLVAALERYLSSGTIDPRLQHAVESMVRRRGRPGSDAHQALRTDQAANAAVPAQHLVAKVVVRRLAALPQDEGVGSTEPLLAPVSEVEATDGVPPETPVAASIRAALTRATAGTVEELVGNGVVQSAEVLATLVPQVAARAVAATYPDESLQRLTAQNYLAFRNRRSLLLLNLEKQVGIDELPWVQAIAGHRNRSETTRATALAALRRLAELTLKSFPATLIPNRMARELGALAAEAGIDAPIVEELAADIFMGTFSPKFLAAAKVAAGQLGGTCYERYYAIDYAAVGRLGHEKPRDRHQVPGFADLCRRRAGHRRESGWSVAANGMVIEQAQILTTHNLAVLTGPVGLASTMGEDWPRLAKRCFEHTQKTVAMLERNPKPLRAVKNAAYAWRQMIFYLAGAGERSQQEFVPWAVERLASGPDPVRGRLAPALDGLTHVLRGGRFDQDGNAPHGRRLQGWVVGRHWMLASE